MVYFVVGKHTGLLKIGITRKIHQRLKSLREPVDVKALITKNRCADRYIELRIHAKFEKLRVFGEWFRDDGSIQRFIDRLLLKDWATLEIPEMQPAVAATAPAASPASPVPVEDVSDVTITLHPSTYERIKRQASGIGLMRDGSKFTISEFVERAALRELAELEFDQSWWLHQQNLRTENGTLYDDRLKCPTAVAVQFAVKYQEILTPDRALKMVSA